MNKNGLATAVIVGWVLAVLFAVSYVAITSYYQESPTSEQEASDPKGGVPGEVSAHARAANSDALARAKAALAQIAHAEALMQRWDTKAEPLLTNDTGRAIAASPDLIKDVRRAWATKPPAADFAAARANIEGFIAPITRALGNPRNTTTPLKETLTLFDAEKGRADKVANSYTTALQEIDGILARVAALHLTPSATTLRDAMEQQRIEQGAVAAIKRDGAEEEKRLRVESRAYQELIARDPVHKR
jgi:hypothetical protein